MFRLVVEFPSVFEDEEENEDDDDWIEKRTFLARHLEAALSPATLSVIAKAP